MRKIEKKNGLYEELKSLAKENPAGFTRAVAIEDGRMKFVNSVHGRYVVAFTDYHLSDFRGKDAGDVLLEQYNFIAKNPKTHGIEFIIIGWLDGKGRYCVDLGITTDNLEEALTIAKKYKQRVVTDLHEFNAISV